MPPPLMDGQVAYPDGTEATVSQMAKDVAVFLNWASEPEHDDRKKVAHGSQSRAPLLFFHAPYALRPCLEIILLVSPPPFFPYCRLA